MNFSKTVYAITSVTEGVEDPFFLEYYLTSEIYDGRKVYGFEALKKNEDGIVAEEVQISDFTSVKEIAERFLKLLFDGLVTPLTVFDIADDFLGIEYGAG